MPNTPYRPLAISDQPPAVAVATDSPQRPDADDDIVGWECAHPALQIERWGFEDTSSPGQTLV